MKMKKAFCNETALQVPDGSGYEIKTPVGESERDSSANREKTAGSEQHREKVMAIWGYPMEKTDSRDIWRKEKVLGE